MRGQERLELFEVLHAWPCFRVVLVHPLGPEMRTMSAGLLSGRLQDLDLLFDAAGLIVALNGSVAGRGPFRQVRKGRDEHCVVQHLMPQRRVLFDEHRACRLEGPEEKAGTQEVQAHAAVPQPLHEALAGLRGLVARAHSQRRVLDEVMHSDDCAVVAPLPGLELAGDQFHGAVRLGTVGLHEFAGEGCPVVLLPVALQGSLHFRQVLFRLVALHLALVHHVGAGLAVTDPEHADLDAKGARPELDAAHALHVGGGEVEGGNGR
mmetsp:Transcript_39318/g.113767  ORF Transcript_39318/g.113767 Transcript_39318/m.113767 type:complete len:264 (-) Transcript_39318:88-879(-)